MKNNWQTKKLGEVCDFKRGLTYSKRDETDFSSNVVLRANNIDFKTNSLELSDLRYIKDSIKISKDKKVSKGSIVICTASGSKSHLGKVALIDGNYDFAFGGFMGQMIPGQIVDSKYFYYTLTSVAYKKFIGKLTDGVNINNLKFVDLKEYSISIPPLPEQRRIVAILDKAFTAIAKAKENAKKNLANSRELFESYLQSVFANPGDGWEEKKLGDVCDITSSKRIFKKEYVNSGIPFYRSKEIKELANNNKISLKYFISIEKYNEIKNKYGVPRKGDILLTAVGTIGEMYVVNEGDVFYFKDGNIVWLRNFKTIDTYYLRCALTAFVEKIKSLSIGSAYNALTIEKLVEYAIPIPPLPEQRRIVSKLDSLSAETRKLEAICRQKLAGLEELKKSVLQKAFNGEL